MAFQFIYLTQDFYNDHASCSEIEKKSARPHVRMLVRVEGLDFAIPMRSHISHPHSFLTDKANGCGLDFSKAVLLTDPARYIDSQRAPHIRQNEFDALRGKEYVVEQGMKKYINTYRKALLKPEIPRNKQLLSCSTHQYYHAQILKKSPADSEKV